jgi:hypothetical protein
MPMVMGVLLLAAADPVAGPVDEAELQAARVATPRTVLTARAARAGSLSGRGRRFLFMRDCLTW